MKERQSVKFANYTKTREEWYKREWYKRECDEILYRTKSKIILEGDLIYSVTNNHKIFLLTTDNPKSKWFQTWLKLRDDK